MILNLRNIGMVREASVEIKGIAVIAGENNTGKSTVGKALYWLFSGLYRADESIERDRRDTIENMLWNALRLSRGESSDEDVDPRRISYISDSVASRIMEMSTGEAEKIEKTIRNGFGEALSMSVDESLVAGISGLADKISDTLSMGIDEALSRLLDRGIRTEFCGQISPLGRPGPSRLELVIKGEPTTVLIDENEVKEIKGPKRLDRRITYIDDPFALDELSGRSLRVRYHRPYILSHRDSLLEVLSRDLLEGHRDTTLFDEISIDRQLNAVMEKLNEVGVGTLQRSRRGEISYTDEFISKPLDARNLSTGLKTFAMLRTLIESGTIAEGSTIILDEPEVHLHPEWQLMFAEIIVLLQKELDLHVLINTHSPYFLYSIEVSSARHSVADRCTYYLAEREGNGGSVIRDVSDDLEAIYQKLAAPLERLQDEEYGL